MLDNAEHLLDGAELFAEILKKSSQLKLLISSRERLNLQSEWVFEIQGLPVPPGDQTNNLEEYSSATLFLQSAQRIQAGFKLQEEDRWWVIQVCRLLEGLPLEERLALCQLSVFQGGFTREAAHRVAEAPLGMLYVLIDKSLLRRKENERYDLHELIRQYASTHLAEFENEEELTRQRHSTYYLELVQNYKERFKSSNQKFALAELTMEIDNLRQAWDWAVERL